MVQNIKESHSPTPSSKVETEVVKETPQNIPNLITIPQVKAKEFIQGLGEALCGIEELKAISDGLADDRDKFQTEIIKKLNSLYESTSQLRDKIEQSGTYEKYLEERLKNTSLQQDVVLLQTHLEKEKFEFNSFISSVKNKIDALNDSYTKYNDKLDESLNDFGQAIIEKYTKQYDALRLSSQKLMSEYVSNTKQNTDVMKDAVLNFLKQCQSQNRDLIGRIPKVNKNKYELKDVLIIVFSVCGILSILLANIIPGILH